MTRNATWFLSNTSELIKLVRLDGDMCFRRPANSVLSVELRGIEHSTATKLRKTLGSLIQE